MAFLVIAGITVRVVVDGASEQASFEIGGDSRAYAGNLRSTGHAEKRNFQFTSALLTTTQYETLRDAIKNGQQVACTGDVIPSDNYRVRLTRNIKRTRSSNRCIAVITMQQV